MTIYRTDRNLLYFYNGTRWLTVQQYRIDLTAFSAFYGKQKRYNGGRDDRHTSIYS